MLLMTEKAKITLHALPSLPHTPRNTSGYGFPSTPTSCLFICVLYHPPNSVDSIYTSLSEIMDLLLPTHPNCLFLTRGDFTCHHASWLVVGTSLTCHGTSAKAFCDSLGLTQSVNFPTRISTNSTLSLLDLILTNFPENICCSSSAPIGSSDHVLIKVDISLAIIREPPHRCRVWHFTQANWQGLQAAIKLLD